VNTPPPPEGTPWYEPLSRLRAALVELVAHLIVLAALLGGIRLLEEVIHRLWGTPDYLFFDRIKLRYIFDGADLLILVGFLSWGVYSVVAAYVGKSNGGNDDRSN